MSEFREIFARAASHAADYRDAVSRDAAPLSVDYPGMLERVSARDETPAIPVDDAMREEPPIAREQHHAAGRHGARASPADLEDVAGANGGEHAGAVHAQPQPTREA